MSAGKLKFLGLRLKFQLMKAAAQYFCEFPAPSKVRVPSTSS